MTTVPDNATTTDGTELETDVETGGETGGEQAGVGASGTDGEQPAGAPAEQQRMTLENLLDRLEELFADLDTLDDEARRTTFELLDGIDKIHRVAMREVGKALGPAEVERLRAADPAIAWLWEAYSVGVDEKAVADEALDEIRPYIHSHDGEVEVLDVTDGVVHVRLSGACSGCTASAITLQRGVEDALRENYPGFRQLTVEEDEDAEAHPPPGQTLLQIEAHPESSLGSS